MIPMKKLLFIVVTAGLFAVGAVMVSAQTEQKKKKKQAAPMAQNGETAPKSVIHVVTVMWKEGTTEEQIKAALDGVKAMPAKYPGMTRVWVKSFKVQNQRDASTKLTHAFVMEFADEEAFKNYAGSPAQVEWYKVYEPIREASTTHDITN